MSPVHRLLPLLLLCLGCSKLFAKDASPADESQPDEAQEPAAASEAEAPGHTAAAGGGRYGIPFTWERSPEEPLAKARQFMADVLESNASFSGPSRERAAALAETESPRATVLTCSDSRVQASVWDSTPENDSYTVRVLGNQLGAALPSVEYGVDALHTPVLLIIGHTGCEAASTKHTGDEPAKRGKSGKGHGNKEGRGSSGAVVDNVNAQVKEAVSHFAARVQSGDLTVIGAVYDVTNDLGKGPGRLHLVNINGNIEAARVRAFEDAVNEQNRKTTTASKRSSPDGRGRAFLDGSARLPPGERATINAVSVLGNGGFDGIGEGDFRQPLLGTPHDVKPVYERRPSSSLSFASRGLGPSARRGDEHAGAVAHPGMDRPAEVDARPTPPPAAAPERHAAERPADGHGEAPARPAPAKVSAGKRKKASKPADHGANGEAGALPAEPPPLPWK